MAARVALLFGCALSLRLPAPERLSMQSVNLHHTLSWKPGPGTPAGASYLVYDVRSSSRLRKRLRNSTETSTKLMLDARSVYQLAVQAVYKSSRSPTSRKLEFAPYRDTKIGAPAVLLAGCDACLHASVVLPAEGGEGPRVDLHTFYRPEYSVTIRNQAEQSAQGSPYKTKSRNFTLWHLRSGTEYCIRVHVLTVLNQNTQPSAWTCAVTGGSPPSTGPLVASLVAGLGVFLVGAVTASVVCLKHMGFICKLQTVVPAVLLGLRPGYTLTPERTVPDQMFVSPKVQKEKQSGPASPRPEEEEEEEQQEQEQRRYMVGNIELSSDQSPSQAADKLHVAHPPAGLPDCGQDEDEDEDQDEGEEVGDPEVQEDGAEGEEGSEAEELEEQQAWSSSGGINLLSVTLGALSRREEEEQESEWTEQEALLSHHQTSRGVRTPVEGQSTPEEEEEEEEEELSGYLMHS